MAERRNVSKTSKSALSKQAPSKRAAAKKAAPQKEAPNKVVPKQVAAKKAAPKKATQKKAAPKKTSAATTASAKPAAKTAKTSAQTPLPDALPVIAFADEAAWEAWLLAHPNAPGLWLKIAKKTSGIASVDYAGALDVALCHGWIDGQKRGFDTQYFLQRFTPRRSKSLWSKINIGHVERLIAAGRMRAGGLREIDAAKTDGRWAAAYDGASRMDVPEALAAALSRNPKAAAFFETLDKTNRYAVCWRVQTAKTDATRASRVDALVAMLARGEKIHG